LPDSSWDDGGILSAVARRRLPDPSLGVDGNVETL